MTRQKPGEVPRGRARWPCGAVAAAGPPALDGTGRVGSARTTPGAGETVPKLRETCLQFRFRIFGIFGFLDLGGIPRRGAGRQGLAARTLVPFARRGRTSAPGRPRFASLPPAGACERLGLPPRAGCRPRGPRSLRGAVGSSGAAEPRGGDCARIRTRRRGAPPSPISRPGTVAGAPGGPIGVSTPKQMDPGFTRWV